MKKVRKKWFISEYVQYEFGVVNNYRKVDACANCKHSLIVLSDWEESQGSGGLICTLAENMRVADNGICDRYSG